MDNQIEVMQKKELAELKQTSQLTTEEKQKVDEIVKQIDVNDSQAVLQFGVGAQSSISSFSDTVLGQIRAKDSGEVGAVLTDLMVKVKDLDVDSLGGGGLSKLFGGVGSKVKKFMSRYDKLSVQIDKIIDELDISKMQMLKDITLLDSLYDKNVEYLHNLDNFILAGTIKLQELNEKVLPELRAKAQETNDPAAAQRVSDFIQLISRFEKKVHDLKLSRMICIQTAPQIRLIQNNDQVLVEKIQSSIMNTIPLWKNQIIIAITLFRQEKAMKIQRNVTDTTNELLTRNSEMLKQTSIDVAKESERGIVDIETLKKVNTDLIETIEETLRIQLEGKTKRQQAEQELQGMELELKKKLTEIKG